MRGLAAVTTTGTSWRGRSQSPLACWRLHSAAFCRRPVAMASSTPVSVLLLLLATSAASPVLHGYDEVDGSAVDGHSTTTLHDPSDSTSRQETVGSGRSDSVSVTHGQPTSRGSPDGEYAPPQELNAASGWSDEVTDDSLWNFIVSPSDTYEHDEQQPPIAVGKNGSPVDEFTDDPNFEDAHFGERVTNWEEDTATYLDGGNYNKSVQESDAESFQGEMGEQTPAPGRNASKLGPEVGSEEFEQSLGAALNETLRKMKEVLAGSAPQQDDQEGGGWRSALSRLRVKRSDDQSEDAEDLPVRSLNDIVDVFLIIARQSLEDRGLDQVSIPPLERTFSRSLGVGTLRGFFRGDDGWVRRLTTVHRVGDVRLDRGRRPPDGEPWDLRSVSVATSLGLEELTVGFERYVADVRALPTVSGRLLADIDENAVLLNISFSKRDDDPKGCDVVLQELDIQRLEGINLKLTGLGPFNWLLSRIATWLTKHSQDKVADVVEKELAQIANKELQNIPCDADFITAISML
ncbi:uncharacterized protein LOC126162884 [Schistocerca cancellata]|uniref:uncharacterized protein LOC126162884 n=1 Tax=Schistocerca cancellata TaxID=274614 RepID=UPI0021191127|nr:uncharacterized protein LOC126162884 [Schistocerca cancellata]XP_049775642.1 uncharacterized protein LOC126162884 [Schistocerca cancellata]